MADAETDRVGERPACSKVSESLAEPLAGTAASAKTWLCIEQPGPYGPDALVESHFDRKIGAELARRAAGSGVRIQLIRRPGRHADDHSSLGERQIFVAHTRPGRTWLVAGRIADPSQLLSFDFGALGAGVVPSFGRPDPRTLLLVCTNGRRDVCCALRGRPIAQQLARRFGDQVWETTHTGGHRFAPTAVLLPVGYLYGRLDPPFAERLLTEAAAGRMVPQRCRGRSTWSPAGQVAELAVRDVMGECGVDAVVVDEEEYDEPAWRVRVSLNGHARPDVRGSWWVDGRVETLQPERRTSCAKAPVVPTANVATSVARCDMS